MQLSIPPPAQLPDLVRCRAGSPPTSPHCRLPPLPLETGIPARSSADFTQSKVTLNGGSLTTAAGASVTLGTTSTGKLSVTPGSLELIADKATVTSLTVGRVGAATRE